MSFLEVINDECQDEKEVECHVPDDNYVTLGMECCVSYGIDWGQFTGTALTHVSEPKETQQRTDQPALHGSCRSSFSTKQTELWICREPQPLTISKDVESQPI
jgi:hypothetical protein